MSVSSALRTFVLLASLASPVLAVGGEAPAPLPRPSVLKAPAAGAKNTKEVERPIAVPAGVPQLFVDDHLIAETEGLTRMLCQPRKDGGGAEPVIAARDGTSLLAYGSIVHDVRRGRYVMFVLDFPQRDFYRYTSSDGLAWVAGDDGSARPLVFAPPLDLGEGARGHACYDVFSCRYDDADQAYPYKGWLYYANYGFEREGIYYVRSADGQAWERGQLVVNAFAGVGDPSCREIQQEGRTVAGPGDVTLFSWDPAERRLLGIFKFFAPAPLPGGNQLRSRAYAFLEGLDVPFDASRIERIALLPRAAAAGGDRPADEYYATTAWRYGSQWLGGLKVWHGKDDYPYSAAGCAFLKLVTSRDGLAWNTVPFANDEGIAEVFLPNGPEGGEGGRNDGGYISEFSQGPIRCGDELIYYYSASSFGKNAPARTRLMGGGIFRARLRLDGFVAVTGGRLTTRPFVMAGRQVVVNAVGPVTAELLDRDGHVLGRGAVSGDSVRHAVSFAGGEAAGRGDVRLRLSVGAGGRLYSFTVQ